MWCFAVSWPCIGRPILCLLLLTESHLPSGSLSYLLLQGREGLVQQRVYLP